MSLICVNPGCFSGERGDPPEYRSDNERACGQCMTLVDMDDESYLDMDDDTILCSDCRECCAGCGEWITDYSKGEVIQMRCYATGRKEPWHTDCAADYWSEQ